MNGQSITIPFDEELLPAKKLSTTKLSCVYEHGALRYIRYGKTEVIRMIYFAVRDKDWNTAPYTIGNELIETNDNGFSISYSAVHKLDDIEYRTEVLINAVGDSISFLAKGEALTSFRRNRIGICVLHPISECAGKEVYIERPDGTSYETRFPVLIEPHQPFKEIQKMRCVIGNDIKANLSFEGDIFETEDQRNWADSSYKTYSTPLNLPTPAEVKKGDKIEQKIELTITGNHSGVNNDPGDGERKLCFPKIGYCCNGDDKLSDEDIHLLQQIPFDHYRVELRLSEPGWRDLLRKRWEEAGRLQTKIELILFFDDDFQNQLQNLVKDLIDIKSSVVSLLVLHKLHAVTPGNLLKHVYEGIKKFDPLIQVGYGTDGFFADLNRNRPGDNNFDFLSFPLSPQVHASDTRSLLDNLERQQDLYDTARSFAPGKEICISPITFKIKSGPNEESSHLSGYDARQDRNFGALWTLCTIKNLAHAHRITFYEVKGSVGILKDQPGTGQTALYRMLQKIKAFNPAWIMEEDDQGSLPGKVVILNDRGERLEFILSPGDDLRG